jgi:hypothetical protein
MRPREQHKRLGGPREGARVLTDKPQSKHEKVATAEEITEAIEKLLPDEWAKLYAYARNRARMMALYGGAVDEFDLVQLAVTALLEDRRTWNPKKVAFTGLLMGTMRSIASNHKAKALTSGYSESESQLASAAEEDQPDSLIERHPDARLTPEQQMILTGWVAEIYDFFKDDAEACLVMDGWRDDLSGTEIIETLEIDRKGYETIVKRIRRKSAGQWSKVSSHVS